MKNKIIKKCRRILTSNDGLAVYILLFVFLPLIVFVPAVAIDFSAYMTAKTHLQNALDVSAITALNRSTLDQHRADKIIKIIFDDDSSENQFTKKLNQSIAENLRAESSTIENRNHIKIVKPKIYLTPYDVDLTITERLSGGKAYVGSDDTTYNAGDPYSMTVRDTSEKGLTDGKNLRRDYGSNYDIEMVLTTYVDLPVYKKITDIFNLRFNKDMFKVPLTVKSSIRGIRVKSPDDFKQNNNENNEHGFEKI